jgi:hypothetical protein
MLGAYNNHMFVCRRDNELHVCTSECKYRSSCTKARLSFLVHTSNSQCLSPRPAVDGIPITILPVTESHTDSYINDIAKHERDNLGIMQQS